MKLNAKVLALPSCKLQVQPSLPPQGEPCHRQQNPPLCFMLLAGGRVKRGWVWNQFFVVEEYTGTEPLYVGKVK
uniref:Uncharacterized protein n=1 Tax=Terrapene triunguis TaxID=2587831 RepID=A0A674IU19_9SAUR